MSTPELTFPMPEPAPSFNQTEKRVDFVVKLGEKAAEKYLKGEYDKLMRIPFTPGKLEIDGIIDGLIAQAIEKKFIKANVNEKLAFAEGCRRRLYLGYPLGPVN